MNNLALPKIDMQAREAHCNHHGAFTEEGAEIGGKLRWFGCKECSLDKEKRKEEYKRTQAREAERKRLLVVFNGIGIPLRFQNRTFENYSTHNSAKAESARNAALSYARTFQRVKRHGASLILCGSPGTGKTHLAAAVANKIYKDHSVLFRGVLAAVRHVKNTWSRSSEQSEADAIADLVKPDLLILDDVGVQFGSEAEKIILFEIINGRYEQMKPTIITANLTTSELANYLGERVMDRLTEGGGAVIAFDWDSYRSKVAKDPALNGQQNETETEAA